MRKLLYCICAIPICLLSCVTLSRNPAATASVQNGKNEFFSRTGSVPLYYIRVSRISTGLANPEGLNRKLKEGEGSIASGGALLEVFRLTNPGDDEYCPNSKVRGLTPLLAVNNFNIATSGNATAGTPKSSYQLKIKKTDSGEKPSLFGIRTILLKSMWNDVSQAREAMSWHIFSRANVPASHLAYARFCMTDGDVNKSEAYRYFGLYAMIEPVDEEFLQERFAQSSGNLYKANWIKIGERGPANLTYVARDENGERLRGQTDGKKHTYELKTKHGSDEKGLDTYTDIGKFLQILNGRDLEGAPNSDYFASEVYQDKMRSMFDVNTFLRWAAVNSLLGAWDNYWGIPQNYHLYNSQTKAEHMSSPFFNWIPWDYDNTLGSTFWNESWVNADIVDWEKSAGEIAASERRKGTQVPDSHLPLLNNLLQSRAKLSYYLDYMELLLDNVYNVDYVGSYFDQVWKVIGTSAYLEGRRDHHPFEWEQDQPAHTGRLFTNRQVHENGELGRTFANPERRLIGIKEFVKRRSEAARAQIQALRAKFSLPRGASGVSKL